MQTSVISSRISKLNPAAPSGVNKHLKARASRRTERFEIEDGLDSADLTPFWSGDCEHAEIEQPILMNTVFGTVEVAA